MAERFVMPKLGLTMEAGKIVQWLVTEGTEVAPGQPVLVIETDKVESEIESTMAGRLHPSGAVGEEFDCGATIGWFLAEGEDPATLAPVDHTSTGVAAGGGGSVVAAAGSGGAGASAVAGSVAASSSGAGGGSAVAAASSSGAGGGPRSVAAGNGAGAVAATGIGGRLLASPNARRVAAERGVVLATIVGSGPGGRITSEDVINAPTPTAPAAPSPAAPGLAAPASVRGAAPGAAGVLATAAARQLAELLGVDLALVTPSGPDPRLTRDEVAAHVRACLAEPAEGSRPSAGQLLLQSPTSVIPFSGMRGAIANRMAGSLASMAQLTLTMDVDMAGVIADRERRSGGATVPGYTDYVIAATARALVEHPHVNSQVTDDGVALLPSVHVGLAVALDDGLIVPVIHNTLGFDLESLAAETSRLASTARDRKLSFGDLEGGTFSVTSLGMFDVDAFTPIVNAPNTAILGVGRLRDEVAWADDGSPMKATRLTLSLTWDHRAFDGAPAAEFTRSIKRRLESYR